MQDAFPHSYEIDEYVELSPDGRGTIICYPGAIRDRSGSGRLLKIRPKAGQPWVGCFKSTWGGGITDVFSCPNPHQVCVLSLGTAYVVRTDDPDKWLQLPCIPVRQVLPIPSHNLLVFGDFTDVVALGPDGVKWVSDRLAWDELKILDAQDASLHLSVWRGGKSNIEIRVDLSTGQQIASDEEW